MTHRHKKKTPFTDNNVNTGLSTLLASVIHLCCFNSETIPVRFACRSGDSYIDTFYDVLKIKVAMNPKYRIF